MNKKVTRELRSIANDLGLTPGDWRRFKKGYNTIPHNERRASLDSLRTRVAAKKKKAQEEYAAAQSK